MGHGGTCPHFYQWLGTGGTVSRRTANKKLTKLYWPSRKRSPKRLIVLLEPKKWRGTTKKFFFRCFAPNRCPPLLLWTDAPPPPTFKLVPAQRNRGRPGGRDRDKGSRDKSETKRGKEEEERERGTGLSGSALNKHQFSGSGACIRAVNISIPHIARFAIPCFGGQCSYSEDSETVSVWMCQLL